MSVFHIIIGLEIGGAEILLERAVKGLPEVPQEIISLTSLGTIGRRLREQGIPVHVLGLRSVLSLPIVVYRLYRLLKTKKPQVVHTWMYHADLIGGLAAKLAGIPKIIWSIHAANVKMPGTHSALKIFPLCARLSRWLPDKILCVSKAVSDFHTQLGYDASRMIVIPNGIDVEALKINEKDSQELKAAIRVSDENKIVGTVARFNATKDLQTFVSAAKLVLNQDESVLFLMVGPDLDHNNQELLAWVAKTGKQDRFILLGARQDVPTCLSIMDVFCLTSITESFGLAVAEAMAFKVPCVVTNVDALPDLIGNCGVLVSAQDSQEMATALLNMLSKSQEERNAIGERARHRIKENFSLHHMLAQYNDLYDIKKALP